MATTEFQHLQLDEEIGSISGHMIFQEEKKWPYDGQEILYYTGYAVTDSSCCGVGSVVFTYVPGFISKWRYKTSDDGVPISEIDTIRDDELRKNITKIFQEQNNYAQVNFL